MACSVANYQERFRRPAHRGKIAGALIRLKKGVGFIGIASALLQPMMRDYRPMAAPFAERGLADPTNHVLFRGCHGVLDRTTDGVDP